MTEMDLPIPAQVEHAPTPGTSVTQAGLRPHRVMVGRFLSTGGGRMLVGSPGFLFSSDRV